MKINQNLIISQPDSNITYYGGNQEWFPRNTQAQAGCGPVAGANVFLALCAKNPSCIRFSRQKNAVLALMEDVYHSMHTIEVPFLNLIYDRLKRGHRFFKYIPASYGRGILGFTYGVLRHGKKLGMKLHPHVLPTLFCTKRRGLRFILDGLAKGGSVVLLTSHNRHPLTLYHSNTALKSPYPAKNGMKCHFVTITNVIKKGDSVTLVVSTWGRIATIDYNALAKSWKTPLALTSCLFYFTM